MSLFRTKNNKNRANTEYKVLLNFQFSIIKQKQSNKHLWQILLIYTVLDLSGGGGGYPSGYSQEGSIKTQMHKGTITTKLQSVQEKM